jgi:hypothetical protein
VGKRHRSLCDRKKNGGEIWNVGLALGRKNIMFKFTICLGLVLSTSVVTFDLSVDFISMFP